MCERRPHVFTGAFRPPARAASAFFKRYPSTNGPFHSERDNGLPLRFLGMATTENEFFRRIVGSGLFALGGFAPRRRPMLAAIGASAVRMIDGIAGDTT